MDTHIIGRNVEVGDTLRDYIYAVVKEFGKYNLNIISSNVILKKEKKEFKTEFIFNIKGKHTVVIGTADKDVYKSIEKAIPKLNKALRRLSTQIKSHKNTSIKNLEVLDADIEKEPELIQMTLKLQKPLDIDEAMTKLNESKNKFIVFNDHEGIMRTMFEREDGNIGIF